MAGFFENYREHLVELRTRLLRSLIALAIGILLGWILRHDLLILLKAPLIDALPEGSRHLLLLGLMDKFFIDLKLAFYGGLFLALPYILFQAWRFLAPALYPEEKRIVMPVAAAVAVCFVTGVCFCYFVVLPVGFAVLVPYSLGTDATPLLASLWDAPMPDLLQVSLIDYVDFVGAFLLAFGLCFELPVLMLMLDRFGLVSAAWFAKQRRYAIVIIFIVAAILTPPDPGSQLAMAIPLCLLYEIGIGSARLLNRRTGKATPTPIP